MYPEEYHYSINNKEQYFSKQARDLISWFKPFTKIYNNLTNAEWFEDGMLNACYNCIDRHASRTPNKIAIIYDSNEGETEQYTFCEAQVEIIKIANYLQYRINMLKKDIFVAIYMPNSPMLLFTVLACARLGLPHNVIFGGFTAESVSLRIKDSNAKILFTVDKAMREKKVIDFYGNVMQACSILNKEKYDLDCVIVYEKDEVNMEGDTEIVLWNDVLRGDIYERDNIRLSTPKKIKISDNKEKIVVEQRKMVRKDNKLEIEKEQSVKEKVTIDLNAFVPCKPVNSEHVLFCLYTSGSTGKPKGLVHTTGGYLTYAALTTKKVFDIQENDVFCSTADIGWITGHTYSVYGPLILGCTIILMGGIPTFPSSLRSFEMIQKYKITHFYTAPTVIRLLQKVLGTVENEFKGKIIQELETDNKHKSIILPELPIDRLDEQFDMSFEEMQKYEPSSFYRSNAYFHASGYDLSSLRILGTVGEPINREAYIWYKKSFGPYLPVIDTYWQTEAGGIMISAIPYQTYPIPECACVPFYGMQPTIFKENREIGAVIFQGSWPGVARTILNNHERYINAYFQKYEGYYYTGDEGYLKDRYFFIRGREDDVLNVAGHRLSTAEIESACCSYDLVVETAAVGIQDPITCQAVILFCVKKVARMRLSRNT